MDIAFRAMKGSKDYILKEIGDLKGKIKKGIREEEERI